MSIKVERPHHTDTTDLSINDLPVLILKLDGENRITFANKKAGEVFGYSPDDLTGKHFFRNSGEGYILNENDRIDKTDERLFTFENHFETRVKKNDQTKKIIYWSSNQLYDEQNQPAGYILTGTDITLMHKFPESPAGESGTMKVTPGKTHSISSVHAPPSAQRKEEAEQEDRYRRLFDNANEAIFILDAEHHFIECNQKAEQLFQYKSKDLIGKTPDMVSPEYQPGKKRSKDLAKRYIDQVLKGKPQSFRWVHRKRDGTNFHTEIYLHAFRSNGKAYLYGFVLDLSAQKRAEQELLESEERFRILSNLSFEGILILKNGKVVDVNNSLAKMFGYSYEEALKIDFMKTIIPEKYHEIINEKKALNYIKPFEVEGKKKDGTVIPLEIVARIFAHDDKQYRVIAIRDITDRKRVQLELENKNEQLQISLESYRGLFDNASDAIFIQDKEGTFLDVNKSVVEMYGYDPDEITGKTPEFLSARGKNELKEIRKKIKRAFHGEPQNFEFWGRRKNGEIFPKEVRARSGLYFGKKVVIAFALDITARKKAEQKLKESEERFKTLSDLSFEGILIHDRGVILDVNASLEKISGFKREEMIGKNITELVLPKETLEKVRKLIKENKMGPFEIMGWKKNKVLTPFEIEGKPIVYKSRNARVVAIRDITERKKAEQKLRESEERFKMFSDISFEGILIHDDGVIVDLNTAFTRLTGFKREELIGKSILDVAVPQKYHQLLRDHWKEGKRGPIEIVGQNKSGELVPVEVEAKIIVYKNKKVRMVAVRDINKRKKAELKLQKQDKIIKQTNKELNTFLYRSSHDLRGPLTTLLGLTTLAEIENADEKIQHYFSGIKNTVFQMMRILRKLNDIYVLFNEKIELSLINIENLLKTIKFELEKTDPHNEVRKVFINEITEPIRSNEELLSIIILYVMENAVIFKREDTESYAHLTLSKENNYLIIKAEDNGLGIPSKIKSKVFNMFFIGAEQSKGNGLGLYLVKKATEALSGTCHIMSRVDKYTKIIIRIPLKQEF